MISFCYHHLTQEILSKTFEQLAFGAQAASGQSKLPQGPEALAGFEGAQAALGAARTPALMLSDI